ncbi:Dabb family protein [Clostridium sp. CX1]|uniref:Dabb family protein n=1 Tax=Clostridium tanneri TaxID=3037988 RepID=A0ABU4JV77_9CLOT|nr:MULTISPECIES: Dabb family protein [unclassified Clostridium]MCT8977992.1 Dabb family protein [Clostridium sp. CX1]MDW8802055.1 Dabb family protein [Clostridium sp. A1-XYC3]
MIINNLLLKLKSRDTENIKKTQEVLLGMKGKIEVLLDIQAELNVRPSQTAYDIILITKFASMEDMNAYLTHPAHLEVAKFIGNVLDTQVSVCYEI